MEVRWSLPAAAGTVSSRSAIGAQVVAAYAAWPSGPQITGARRPAVRATFTKRAWKGRPEGLPCGTALTLGVACYTLINVNQWIGGSTVRKPVIAMVSRIPITKARINLGQLAKRAHLNNEYFILEKDGIPVIGIMDADEMEDYLELRDPKVRAQIRQSNKDIRAGRTQPAEKLLQSLVASAARPSRRGSE
jgi:hypothetical protein